ncbi:hypothetical protein D6D26_04266 [Aureobasidium pullulans]|nr:hypothetical protein D6D26_04266 [Aureobasidium pullulans]
MELSKNIPTEKQLLESTITNILYWPKRIDWVNVIFLIVLPAWAAYGTKLSLFTFGEGYHNFHHTFPNDFRNAIEWWQYDPCKWLIAGWKSAGLAWDLKSFQYGEIEKRRVQQARKMLDKRAGVLDWGVPIETLPVIEWSEFLRLAKEEGRPLVLIAGVVHDVEKFREGGTFFVKSAVGKDATAMFNGGVYSHSLTATNLLARMRVAVINGGGEVEVLKE